MQCAYHPDRDAFIQCQRCDKPICPHCQVTAPVGFQCPECVKAGTAKTRQATTTFGGAITEQPAVTYVLVGLGVALLAVGYTPAGGNLYQLLGFSPSRGPGEPWRYLTYALAGGGALLPFVTLLALFFVGRESEQLLGRWRFLAVWLLTALGGSAVHGLLGPSGQGLYGSAATLLGIGAAWLMINQKLRRHQAATWVLVLVVVITVISTPFTAIVGSVAVGAACGAVLIFTPNDRRSLHWVFFGAILLGLIVLAVGGALLRGVLF